MSTLSEQSHYDPKDPRHYAPRWLREKSGSRPIQEAGPDTPFSPAAFDAELESAVSSALRHPLDPEVMHEPGYPNELEPRKALRSISVRFAAAVGVSALVAMFFVVVIPASRQADGEAAGASGIVQSIRTALFQPSETDVASPQGNSEFQAIMAGAQTDNPGTPAQSGQLLKQFMQWREKPNPAAP